MYIHFLFSKSKTFRNGRLRQIEDFIETLLKKTTKDDEST